MEFVDYTNNIDRKISCLKETEIHLKKIANFQQLNIISNYTDDTLKSYEATYASLSH